MPFLPPPSLRPGDSVAVVAPSGPFDRASFEKGLETISSRYQPVFTERIFAADGYLAGADSARAAEFQRALDDENVRAIFAARGGYGAMRLLPSLRFPSTPKWLVGFSDFTAIHLAAQKRGWCTLHAPVLTQLGKQPPSVGARLFALLEGQTTEPLTGHTTVRGGVAEGPLLGGNLSVLTRLIGTPWFPELSGCVLFLEDVGERPYRLDRMWTHLALAGLLEGVRGVVFGDFTGCDEKDGSSTSAAVLAELSLQLGVPCAAGFPVGHADINQPLMFGTTVRLDADALTLSS